MTAAYAEKSVENRIPIAHMYGMRRADSFTDGAAAAVLPAEFLLRAEYQFPHLP